MRKLPLFFVLALLALAVFSQPAINDPVLTTSVTSVVTKSGAVRAIGGSLKHLEMNLSVPEKTDWQLPTYPMATVKDSEGNALLAIKEGNPPTPFAYSYSIDVLTKARMTDYLPPSYTIPDGIRVYSLPSPGIQSDDKEIIELAKRLTENSTSDFEKVARLAIWAHKNIVYDEAMTGREESATWVLANKRGVCTEFATLFIALARASGIPARYLTGYSYTSEKGWLGHAWAEVYIGVWVPVDPTWMEAGHLDATHIQVTMSASQKVDSNVFVYMTPGARLEWSGSGMLGSKISEVEVKDSRSMPESSDYELALGAQKIRFGEKTVVYAKLTSKDYHVVDLTIVPCSGENSLAVVGEKEKFALLEPGKEKVVAWEVTAPASLDPSYFYTCPVILNSAYLAEKKASIEMHENTKSVQFDAWAEKSQLNLGDGQTISFSSQSYPTGAKITVIAEDNIYQFPASKASQEISFTPESPGAKEAWVFSNFGGVVRIPYSVTVSRSLSLGKTSIPQRLVESGSMAVSIPILSNSSTPHGVRVTASYGGSSRSAFATFSGKYVFNFTFSNLEAGQGLLSVRADGQGESIEGKIPIEVMPKPSVSIQTSFSNGGDLTNVTFTASKTGDARNIRLYIDGKIAPLSGGSGTIGLSTGSHSMKVVWYDAYGQEFSFEKELLVPKKGTIFEFPGAGSPCPSLLIVLVLFLFASGKAINNTKNIN